MLFFFKHSNSELKISAIWKFCDGIQREEISVSDVRNEFRFQIYKECFCDSLIVKCSCIILDEKWISSMQSLIVNCLWRDQQHILVTCLFSNNTNMGVGMIFSRGWLKWWNLLSTNRNLKNNVFYYKLINTGEPSSPRPPIPTPLSTKQSSPKLCVCFQHLKVFSKCSSVFTQWLYYSSDAVFVQVPFEIESSSTTEKPFGGHFQLTNEALRQVHKIFAYIVCCYEQNLLVILFRCLRRSGSRHVMCVERKTRIMWK